MENQTLPTESITEVVPVSVTSVPVKKKVNIWLIVSLLLLLIIFGFLLWFILVGSKVTNTPTNVITNTTTSTTESLVSESSSTLSNTSSLSTSSLSKDPEIVSVGANINKYVNYELGFSIKFPKFDNVATTCDESSKEKTGKMPIKTFDVTSNSFIISDERIVKWWRTPCSVVNNSLSILQNGFSEEEDMGMGGYKRFPEDTYIAFGKVENDKDLQTVIDLVPEYKGCYVGPKKLLKNTTNIYEVTLVNKNGSSMDPDPESDCYINAMYYFYYSPENKSAVLTDATQSGRFAIFPDDEAESGDVKIEFTNK